MTVSEPPPRPDSSDADERGLAERALDLLVYLPAGALLTAMEDVPDTVAKGRARVDQELRNAKVVGRFAVDFGWRQVKDQIEWLTGDRAAPVGGGPEGDGDDQPAHAPRTSARRAQGARHEPHRVAAARPAAPPRDPEVDRAIPDYDVLAASQVVRRLDGLGHEELRAVVRHERATRGRRTILHRAEQLLAGPGAVAGPAPGEPDALPGAPGSDSA